MDELKILKELSSLMDKVLNETNEYIAKFDINNTFSFKTNEDTLNELSLNYHRLTFELLHILELTDALGAKLASLAVKAENENHIEHTEYFSNLFEQYCTWKDSLLKFLASSDRLFLKKERFKYSTMLNQAQLFINETKIFNKNLNKSTATV